MRANAVKREPELQAFWAEKQIYERLSQNNPGEPFILHDGPPYANGSLHMGHALNKVLKDFINKYQLLQGRKVRYVPGWDCHGLPIELKVLQALKPEERQSLTPIKLRHKARDFALKAVDEQREGFKRYGIWGDWENPYLTLNPEYEAAQIEVFGKMVLNGHIYRGLKPVHWSPSSRTALAEAELEYPEGHTSRSIYAAFPMVSLAPAVQETLAPYLDHLKVAIWTTTPWTIPGNLAVSLNPALTYAVVEKASAATKTEEVEGKKGTEAAEEKEETKEAQPEYWIVAADLVERLSGVLGTTLTVKAKVPGKDLEHSTYRHPLYDRESPIVIGGDYVTTESGTGLVHTAPGHGQEDYIVGQRYGLEILAPVNDKGEFTEAAGPFAGLNVLKEGNAAVIEALDAAGALLKEEPYVHKYPYDWRTKKPTIFRATEQWFASVAGFRDAALKAISEVQWIPAQGENRITPMVAERSDWCISRQRSWGVPIPVFYDEETGEPLLTEETIAHVQSIIRDLGSDAWWEFPVEDLLPESYRDNGRKYCKGTDTMDVWFDSGSSWAAVVNQRSELRYPADLYLEGSDQHRGWFQSSLLTSVATEGQAPYKTVLTHGFALDEQGRKMSKSLGNVLDPRVIIEGGSNQKEEPAYGADVLRLWVSSVDYSSDVLIGKNILKQMADVYRKIRNTARFLLGNLHDFDPVKDSVPYEQLPELDRYMLHRTTEVFDEVNEAFESFQFYRFFQVVQNFCVIDLSNFYLDIAKDRLYISAPDAFRRRSCQTVLRIILENLARAIAPVLCHMAEDIWQHLPYATPYESVFEAGWVQMEGRWRNPDLAQPWQEIRKVRAEVNKVMEQARAEKAIGSSLDAKVLLYVADATLKQKLQALHPTVTSAPVTTAVDATSAKSRPEVTTAIAPEPQPMPTPTQAPISSPPETSPEVNAEQAPLPQWRRVVNQVAQPFTASPTYLWSVLKDYYRLVILTLLIPVAALPIYFALAVLSAVHEIPFLPLFFKVVGVLVVGRLALQGELRKSVLKIWDFLADSAKLSGDSVQAVVQATEEKLEATATPEASLAPIPPVEEVLPESEIPAVAAPEDLDTPLPPATLSNGVDELRYLFIASQVELKNSLADLATAQYQVQSEALGVGVVTAGGHKCDRCWNYSTHVGKSAEHPLLCERCVPALAGEF